MKGELRHSLFKRREITIFFPLEEEGKLFSSPPSRGRSGGGWGLIRCL
jgi:hypothetical protein